MSSKVFNGDQEVDDMRVTREQAAQNRERVLDTASKLFRERGFGGIGVADLMKSAGLTHGGFYGQFESKEDLMAQASARALEASLNRWRRLAERASADPLSAVTSAYLSSAHRDRPGDGCLLAALGAEASREGPAVRRAVTEGTRAYVEMLAGLVPGRSKDVRRERALATFADMVGAIVLARAVDDAALSREILQAVAKSISDSRTPSK
jgi:TetR/AcrR family transcriptional regulator, transcriptional repressor for nem operon